MGGNNEFLKILKETARKELIIFKKKNEMFKQDKIMQKHLQSFSKVSAYINAGKKEKCKKLG